MHFLLLIVTFNYCQSKRGLFNFGESLIKMLMSMLKKKKKITFTCIYLTYIYSKVYYSPRQETSKELFLNCYEGNACKFT